MIPKHTCLEQSNVSQPISMLKAKPLREEHLALRHITTSRAHWVNRHIAYDIRFLYLRLFFFFRFLIILGRVQFNFLSICWLIEGDQNSILLSSAKASYRTMRCEWTRKMLTEENRFYCKKNKILYCALEKKQIKCQCH